jgi:predicted ATPase
MYLEKLQLSNYRAFRAAEVNLPDAGTLLVAGANNSGKSALLSALDVLAGRGVPADVRYAGSEEGPRLNARLRLTDAERLSLLSENPDGSRYLGLNTLEWVDLHFGSANGGFALLEVTGAWPGVEELRVAWNERADDGAYSLQSTDITQLRFSANPQGSIDYGAAGAPLDIIGQGLGHLRGLFEALNAWRASFYHFYALRPGTTEQQSMTATPVLEPTGGNLPAVLLWLYHNDVPTWTRLQKLISEVIPDVGQLVLPVEGNTVHVAFEDRYFRGFRHNLKRLGTGVEQLLLTMVVGLTHPAPSVVVVEEPETNLHPGAQRALLALLEEWGTNRLFIASTHSATMLDWTRPDKILHVTRMEGSSHVESAENDPMAVLTGLGVRLSDVLSAERLLLVEGPSDKEVLEAWFPTELRDPTLAIIPSMGGDNARYAPVLQRWLAEADKIQRRVLFLRDKDELPHDLLEKMRASNVIHVLEARELENYLLNEDAIVQVLNARRGSKTTPIERDRVASALEQAINGLQRAIVVGRVCRRKEVIRLADHVLRHELMRKNANLDALTSAILEKLPTPANLAEELSTIWREEEGEVNAAWRTKARYLAPGADVLGRVFTELTGQGYSKDTDGPALARAMTAPPSDLRDTVLRFLAGDG